MSHTRGPWQVALHSGRSFNGAAIKAPDGLSVAIIPRIADRPYDQKEADARMIAATPELLASCKELREAAAAMMRVLFDAGLEDQLVLELLSAGVKDGFGKRAGDVIAKAESA